MLIRIVLPDIDLNQGISNFKKAVAVFCLLAILSIVCVQTFHTHPGSNSSVSESGCSVCMLVHSNVAPVPVADVALTLPELQSFLHNDLYDFSIKSQTSTLVLFIRPPAQA